MGLEDGQISEIFGLVKLNIKINLPHRFLQFRSVVLQFWLSQLKLVR